jgi:outer membrane receptor protein involved in Fe transport
MPTFNDLYYTHIGNKALKPEYTTQYNAGLFYSNEFISGWFRNIEVRIDGYFNLAKDKIIAYPSGGQGDLYRWTMINLGYVKIRGIDASLQAGFRAGDVLFNLRASYTWQKSQDFTDKADAYYGGFIPYAPVHSGSAVANAAWQGWDLNYSFIYTGERWDSRANILQNYIKPWYTSDLALSKTIRLKRSELRATVEVNNVFNQQYDVVLNYPMPGTNFMLKITWTL